MNFTNIFKCRDDSIDRCAFALTVQYTVEQEQEYKILGFLDVNLQTTILRTPAELKEI